MHPISLLTDPRLVLKCSNNTVRSDPKLYRVPLEPRMLAGFGVDFDNAIKTAAKFQSSNTLTQLIDFLMTNGSVGLLAPTLCPPGGRDGTAEVTQADLGSIILFAPQDWPSETESYKRWLPQGEDPFDGLSFSRSDILVFAGVNFSPDAWFVVTRGPMAGAIYWSAHDDCSYFRQPWATDLPTWAVRVKNELPLLFGGIIRFDADATPDGAPPGTELFPVELVVE